MGITIKGAAPDATQLALINQVMGIAKGLSAGPLATQALLEACIQENDFTNNPGGGGGSSGILQLLPSTAAGMGISQLDVVGCVTAFLTKGFYSHGGAIAQARANPGSPAWQIAQNTQGSAYPMAYDQWAAEANAIIAAYGGAGIPGAGGTAVNGSKATTYQFTVGTTDNPSEDYWTAINRLASEVRWALFSNGEYLYFMDGPELIAQKPAAYIDRVKDRERIAHLSFTWDNTSFQYRASHKHKGRVQHATKLAQISTPTEGRLDVICAIDEFRAGDVVVLSSCGPGDGRWIIGDCTRSVFATFSSLTLNPPIAPLSEQQVGGHAAGAAGGAASGTALAGNGSRGAIVAAARKAVAEQSATQCYTYQEIRPYPGSLFGRAPRVMDCSGFSILCYKAAGCPDPNGTGYDGSGYTGSLLARGKTISNPQPGDLCFYYGGGHVAVALGGGLVASMGSPGDPHEMDISACGGYPYTCRDYLS